MDLSYIDIFSGKLKKKEQFTQKFKFAKKYI